MESLAAPEIAKLLAEGLPYLDVRTEREFAEGHPPGAFNIPFQIQSPGGMVENRDFLPLCHAHFDLEKPLIVGCRSGARSKAACSKMEAAGFLHLFELADGFDGRKDPFGRPLPGWRDAGLPIEIELPKERTYVGLRDTDPPPAP